MLEHLETLPDVKDKKRFSEKVATTDSKQFDGIKEGGAWKSWCRSYLISQAREMDTLLRLTEASEDREVTTQQLQAMTSTWIHLERVSALSFELWGFLNLNLIGKAKQTFDNIRGLEAFEAWRRILKLVRDRAAVRKITLNDKVHRPDEAKRLSDVPTALEEWDACP